MGVEQRGEAPRALGAVGGGVHAEHEQPVEAAAGRRAEWDAQRHAAVDGAVEVHEPLRGRAERRCRVARRGVVGIRAERQRVRDRAPEHGELARAAAVAERDPAVGQHVRPRRPRPGPGALGRRRRGRGAGDPRRPRRPEAVHERAPGLEGRGGRHAARLLAVEVRLPPSELLGGQLRLVRVDVQRVGINAHEQVAAVEAGLQPHRQQRQRHVGSEQRDEVVGAVAGDERAAQTLDCSGRRARDPRERRGDQRVPPLPGGGHLRALRSDAGAQRAGQRLDRRLTGLGVGQLLLGRRELLLGLGELRLGGLELGVGGGQRRVERRRRGVRRGGLLAGSKRGLLRVERGPLRPGDLRRRRVLLLELLEHLDGPVPAALGGVGGAVGGGGRRPGGRGLRVERVERLRRRGHARLGLGDRLLERGDAARELREVGTQARAVGLGGDEPVGQREGVGLGRQAGGARRGDRRQIGHALLRAIRRDACMAIRNGCWKVTDAVLAAFLPHRACRPVEADSSGLLTSAWPDAVTGTCAQASASGVLGTPGAATSSNPNRGSPGYCSKTKYQPAAARAVSSLSPNPTSTMSGGSAARNMGARRVVASSAPAAVARAA